MRLLFTFCLLALCGMARAQDKYVLVIHGGAGTILRSQLTPKKRKPTGMP